MGDVSLWWSIALAGIGVFGLFLTTKKLPIGFAIGFFVQLLWVAYAIATQQWGFIGSAAAYGWVNFRGWRLWTKEARALKDS
jgi:flagellar biosynthesis protein FliR